MNEDNFQDRKHVQCYDDGSRRKRHGNQDYNDNDNADEEGSKFLTYTLATVIAGVMLIYGVKEGCKRIDKHDKAVDKHIQETYNPKGLQKRIDEGRE